MMPSNFPSNVQILTTPRYLESSVSTGNYANFNLATHTGDNLAHSDICLDANSNNCEGGSVIMCEKNMVCAVMTANFL